MNEDWSALEDYPAYVFSSMGRIKRRETGRLIAPQSCGSGRYQKVSLYSDRGQARITVHSLIATAFHGPRPPGYVCAHLNNQGTDNRASNLAWVTPAENQAHKGPRISLSQHDCDAICAGIGKIRQTELAERFAVSVTTIQSVQREFRAKQGSVHG